MRPDIADIRLAEYVFAPHYVAAVTRRTAQTVELRAGPRPDAEVIATLNAGETFELLDETGGTAWGIATAHGLVGYVPAHSLERTA